MNPSTNRKQIILPLLVGVVLACFGLSSQMQAVVPPPDGCYPNFTTAEGCGALSLLTTGAANTGLGWRSLFSNTDGSFNTGVGAGTLVLNMGDSNTAVGTVALLLNTTGILNTAIGTDAMVYNDTGSSNTATGALVLFGNTTGGFNTGIGRGVLYNNTTGSSNTAIGAFALFSNTTEDGNTAIGNAALFDNTTGENNTGVGRGAGDNITEGTDNVCVGVFSGTAITTGNNIITIGPVSGVHSIFGQVDDRTYIANIRGASVDSTTAQLVYVDADGRLGTNPTPAGPERSVIGPTTPKGVPRQGMSDDAKQAMLNRKVETLEATVAQQQKQIQALTSGLQKVSAQLATASPPRGGLEASKFATGTNPRWRTCAAGGH